MVIAATQPNTEAELTTGEKRVVIRGLSWAGYLQILDALPQSRGSRLTYDDGVLEIAMPLEDHEFYRSLIECFIRTLIELMGMRIKTIGSTTIKYPQLKKGAEPDNAYYIKNQPLVKGRNVDFTKDPPPDLVVEVDITHTDIDKNKFYTSLGVSEFWRFNGQSWYIYQLQENLYIEVETSPTFPTVPKERLYNFLQEAKEDEIEAIKSLRHWWHQQCRNLY